MILQPALDLILKRKNKETLRLVHQVAAQGADAAHLFLRRYVRVVGHTFVTCTPSLTPSPPYSMEADRVSDHSGNRQNSGVDLPERHQLAAW